MGDGGNGTVESDASFVVPVVKSGVPFQFGFLEHSGAPTSVVAGRL